MSILEIILLSLLVVALLLQVMVVLENSRVFKSKPILYLLLFLTNPFLIILLIYAYLLDLLRKRIKENEIKA